MSHGMSPSVCSPCHLSSWDAWCHPSWDSACTGLVHIVFGDLLPAPCGAAKAEVSRVRLSLSAHVDGHGMGGLSNVHPPAPGSLPASGYLRSDPCEAPLGSETGLCHTTPASIVPFVCTGAVG